MIQKEIRIINDREIHLFFDTEQKTYSVSNEAMEALLESARRDIPKKLLNYNKISAAGNCPCCMTFVDSCAAYCQDCGQRLEGEE